MTGDIQGNVYIGKPTDDPERALQIYRAVFVRTHSDLPLRGVDVGASLCSDFGLPGDAIACANDCTLDLSECTSCGDGICSEGELADGDCMADCDACGDGTCDPEAGETCGNCEDDCGECVYEGDCCAENGSAGCDDSAIVDCVCALDPYCCDTEWDELCIQDLAIGQCGLECPLCGDEVCEDPEDCESCPYDCGWCPFEGDCCEAGETPGCDQGEIVDCLCDLDPFCCEGAWDEYCVNQAIGSCGLDCNPCGDGVIQPGEQCDGDNVQGLDCAALGIGFGELFCHPDFCTFDTSDCAATGCGDGIVQPGEQ